MDDRAKTLTDRVDSYRDDLVTLTQELIRINTVNPYAGAEPTGLEGPGQEHIRPIMEGLGAKTHLFEPPPDIYTRMQMLGPKGRSWKGRPNLVSVFELGPGPTLVINSHMDTVGAAGMDFDPFDPIIKDGCIQGRGSSDDKGGMAMGITAIRALLANPEGLSGTIIHQSVVDEECNGSGAGTLACIDRGFTGDQAVVIDGGSLHLMRGCQGVLTADLHVRGRSGHAAHGGLNAIDKAIAVKQGIDRFKATRESDHPDALVNLGIFQAGVHPAVVPGSARLSLNIVYTVDEAAAWEAAGNRWDGGAVRADFERHIRDAEAVDPWLAEHPSQIDWVKDLIPFETSADHHLVTSFAQTYRQVRGQAPTIRIMAAWADAANLARYGNTPSILFGPGTPGAPHADNETVRIDDLVDGAKVVATWLDQRLRN